MQISEEPEGCRNLNPAQYHEYMGVVGGLRSVVNSNSSDVVLLMLAGFNSTYNTYIL